jgi:aspartyl-tRNA(Asn)/glutamyl-tRNA(Gln) amidotransferase subunit A
MPVATDVAFRFGEKSADPLSMFLADVFTVQANVVGFPALAFPTGHTNEGMPIGLQLMAKPFDEAGLLQMWRSLVS